MGKKSAWLWTLLGFAVLLTGYLATRLPNLTALPIFTDEAIYIRWSQIGMRDAAWRFISLTDGKQPMFTWVMMALLRIFQGIDPLWVGRFTSVFSGAGTLIGLWFLSYELFRDKKIAWLTGALYIIMPFTLWYDRMALYDSMVSTFSVWSLYLGVVLAKHPRLDTALILGMVLAGGMLNKSSGFLSLYFLPATLLVFDWRYKQQFFRWVFLVGVAAVLSQIFYSVLRLSPYFHIVGQKNNVFVFSLSEWMNQPFRFTQGNLRGMFDWLRQYMTVPLFVIALMSWFTRWPKMKERSLLFVWWILPFMALANFAKILYPRFILFMTMPLILLAAFSLHTLWGKYNGILKIIVLTLLIPSVYLSTIILQYPQEASIPFADRGQFIDSWPAGGGVKEVVAYVRAESLRQKVSVYTEGTFGLMPYAIEIYLVDNPNVKIQGIWPLPEIPPEEMMKDARALPTFFILNETQVVPSKWPLTLIGEYEKGKSPERRKLRFYRVTMSSSASRL